MHTCFAGWCRARSNYGSSRRWECLGASCSVCRRLGALSLGLSLSRVTSAGSGRATRSRDRDPAGRARIALRALGRQVAALRSHSTVAWCEAVQARRCRALHTTAGRGSLSGCARPRAAGRIAPVPRRRSGDAMRRKGPAGRCSKAVLLPAGHLRPGIHVGVYPAQPR